MKSTNCPAPDVWVFIAQLVERCSADAEAIEYNPVEVLKFFWEQFAIAQIAINTVVNIS